MPNFSPLVPSDKYLYDAQALAARFAEHGYLYFKELLDASQIAAARDEIIAALKMHGFVEPHATSDARWSGKLPVQNELAPDGIVTSDIARLGILEELALTEGLISLLERVLGGSVHPWEDNGRRLRLKLNTRQGSQSPTGTTSPLSTSVHQDFYFYRPIQFCIVWMPLMDMDESVGGLAIGQGSHREGLHEVWWHGKTYLGVADSRRQAAEWQQNGAVVVAGEVKLGNEGRVWLRSDYRMGDVLLTDPLMMHAGAPNESAQVRFSAGFRYQRQGTPTH